MQKTAAQLSDHFIVIWQFLSPGALADESEFVASSREDAKRSGRAYAKEQV